MIEDSVRDSYLKICASVINRALLDGMSPKNNFDRHKKIKVNNELRRNAREWFNADNSSLILFCDVLGWEVCQVRKLANKKFKEYDSGNYTRQFVDFDNII